MIFDLGYGIIFLLGNKMQSRLAAGCLQIYSNRRGFMSEIEKSSQIMADEEYLRRIGIYYKHIMSLRKDSDYVVNQPQMDKLIRVIDFFEDAAKSLDGKVDQVSLIPSQTSGDVTAYYPVFYIHSEMVERFCDVMRGCSAISIDPTASGEVCFSCTVPRVFVPIDEK